MIKIVNIRTTSFDANSPIDFKIDRTSPVGNPFPMYNEIDRDIVCNEYDKYFVEQMSKKCSDFTTYINKMVVAYGIHGKLRLFCWCAPKRCHGETIKKYILEDSVASETALNRI